MEKLKNNITNRTAAIKTKIENIRSEIGTRGLKLKLILLWVFFLFVAVALCVWSNSNTYRLASILISGLLGWYFSRIVYDWKTVYRDKLREEPVFCTLGMIACGWVVIHYLYLMYISIDIPYMFISMKMLFDCVCYWIMAHVFLEDRGQGISLEKLYPKLIFCLGLMYMLAIPIGEVPDEGVHMVGVYRTSNMMMLRPDHDPDVTVIRAGDLEVMDGSSGQLTKNDHEKYWKDIAASETDNARMNYSVLKNGVGTKYIYLPQAIGFTIGRLLNRSGVGAFFLARIFSLIFFTAVMTICMKILPFGKRFFMVFSMLPMMMQQAMSLSYDVVIIPMAILIIAECMRLTVEDDWKSRLNITRWIVVAVCVLLMLFVKSHAYIMMAFVPLIPLLSRGKVQKVLTLKRILITVGTLFLLAMAALFALVVYARMHPDFMPYVEVIGPPENSPIFTIPYLLHNPIWFLWLPRNTMLNWGVWTWVESMVGTSLGWVTIELNPVVGWIFMALLFLTAIDSTRDDLKLNRPQKAVSIVVFLVTVLFIYLGMMISWSPIKHQAIVGVQGRYMYPVLLLLVGFFQNNIYHSDDRSTKRILMWGLFAQYFSICQILALTLA